MRNLNNTNKNVVPELNYDDIKKSGAKEEDYDCVDRVYDLVPMVYYMNGLMDDSEEVIDRISFDKLEELLIDVSEESKENWTPRHIQRMIRFIGNTALRTYEDINKMYQCWYIVSDEFDESLWSTYDKGLFTEIESLLFCVREAGFTMRKLIRVAKKLNIDVNEVLDIAGGINREFKWIDTYQVNIDEEEHKQLVEWLDTQETIIQDAAYIDDTIDQGLLDTAKLIKRLLVQLEYPTK